MSISNNAKSQTLAIKLVEQAVENALAFGVSKDRLFDAVREHGVGTGQPVEFLEVERPRPETLTIYTVWGTMPDRELRLFGAVDGKSLDNEPVVWDTIKSAASLVVGSENVRVAWVDVSLPLNLIKPIHQ